MRIALCFSGQMRTFDEKNLLKLHNSFIDKYDCGVFISTWENRGVSNWSEIAERSQSDFHQIIKEEKITSNMLSKIHNIKDFVIEDYQSFLNNINDENILNLLKLNADSIWQSKITSYPELYKLNSCNNMKKNFEVSSGFEYDIVIRTRPDMLHYNIDLDKYFNNVIEDNKVYIINSGYSNIVYTVFFFGNSKTMDLISDSWVDYYSLVSSSGTYDICYMLYKRCMLNNIEVGHIDIKVGDIYRMEEVSFEECIKRFKDK